MSDIADMLGLSAKSSSGNLASDEALKIMGDKVKSGKPAKKPKGMSREVYDLLGKDGVVPSVQGNVVIPNFKSKRVNALKGKWVWTHIKSSARQNNQPVFYHWIKADQTYVDYPYAAFNVKFDNFQYTDEEYDLLFNDDPSWSKADTDNLVETCHKYDMRWPIIADRIELNTPRTVEEMQDRYYTIRAIIMAKRNDTTNSFSPASVATGFNVEHERKRRRAQDMLFKKTKEDEIEEQQLREELKAIDAALKRNKKAKAAAAAADAASTTAAAAVTAVAASSSTTTANPSTTSASFGPGLVPRTILAPPGAGGVENPAPAGKTGSTTSATPSVTPFLGPARGRPCLQSSRLYSGTVPPINLMGGLTDYGVTKQDISTNGANLSKKLLNKMTLYLRELEIPENPLPTKTVCDMVEQIKLDTVTLLSLHNTISRKEKELLQLQASAVQGDGAVNDGSTGNNASKAKSGARVTVKKESKPTTTAVTSTTTSTIEQSSSMMVDNESVTVSGHGVTTTEDLDNSAVWVKQEPGYSTTTTTAVSEGGDDQSNSANGMQMDVVGDN